MEKLAKDYFKLMISKGSIPENWNYYSSITKDNSTTIYFTHGNGKRSSFRIHYFFKSIYKKIITIFA